MIVIAARGTIPLAASRGTKSVYRLQSRRADLDGFVEQDAHYRLPDLLPKVTRLTIPPADEASRNGRKVRNGSEFRSPSLTWRPLRPLSRVEQMLRCSISLESRQRPFHWPSIVKLDVLPTAHFRP